MNSPPLSVSIPRMGKGKSVRARWRAARTGTSLRCKRGRHSVHPVATSVSESRVQVPPLALGTTMGHQVCFQKAGLGLLPLLERADGNRLLEQGSRPCGGEATLTQSTLRTQEAIRRRSTHGKELPAALLRQVQMLMPLQRLE
jgi:hypothetical protein